MDSGKRVARFNGLALRWRDVVRARFQDVRAWLGPQQLLGDGVEDRHFLPNFCNGRTIVNVVVIAQMLALIIALVTRRISPSLFKDLLLISVFVQWVALASVATLCAARGFLNKLPNLRALGMAYLILLCATWVASEAVVWIMWAVGAAPSPRPEWYGYFHVQNLSVAAIVNGLALRYFIARHHLRQRTQSEAHAKIQALRSRIRPHFLFNTMNIIASLTRSAPDKAEAAIEDMADLVRSMLGDEENLVPVSNEIAIARKYLDIERLRLDNRLNVDWHIGKFPRRAVMPVLTLQPLLENAIQHGIEPMASGGTVGIKLWEENDIIHINVTNPVAKGKSRGAPRGGDLGLDNVRQRLESHYGTLAKLEITEDKDQFTVAVMLPTRGGKP